jgi:hypothetical protein
MLKLTLDGRPVGDKEYGGNTLGQVIDKVEKDLAPRRVIVSMRLNGEPLDRQEEKQSGALPVDELESLEISTQQVGSLASDTLHTLVAYFPQLKKAIYSCIETMQGEDESEGHHRLGALIEGLQMVSSAWHGIAHFLEVGDRRPGEVMPDMTPFNVLMNDMLAAQQNNDIVQICDLLEFELVPIIESWEDYAAGLVTETAVSH